MTKAFFIKQKGANLSASVFLYELCYKPLQSNVKSTHRTACSDVEERSQNTVQNPPWNNNRKQIAVKHELWHAGTKVESFMKQSAEAQWTWWYVIQSLGGLHVPLCAVDRKKKHGWKKSIVTDSVWMLVCDTCR